MKFVIGLSKSQESGEFLSCSYGSLAAPTLSGVLSPIIGARSYSRHRNQASKLVELEVRNC